MPCTPLHAPLPMDIQYIFCQAFVLETETELETMCTHSKGRALRVSETLTKVAREVTWFVWG